MKNWYEDEYTYKTFYEAIEETLDAKGEVEIEWGTTRAQLVRQMNWMRFKRRVTCTWKLKKPENPDWYILTIQKRNTI